jgi:hypothetical protein
MAEVAPNLPRPAVVGVAEGTSFMEWRAVSCAEINATETLFPAPTCAWSMNWCRRKLLKSA